MTKKASKIKLDMTYAGVNIKITTGNLKTFEDLEYAVQEMRAELLLFLLSFQKDDELQVTKVSEMQDLIAVLKSRTAGGGGDG